MNMPLVREQIVKRFTRSSGWSKTRKLFLSKNPKCPVCGQKATDVHHVVPFHVKPEWELNEENLIQFCERDHFVFGHLFHWKAWNPNVRYDVEVMARKVRKRSMLDNEAE